MDENLFYILLTTFSMLFLEIFKMIPILAILTNKDEPP